MCNLLSFFIFNSEKAVLRQDKVEKRQVSRHFSHFPCSPKKVVPPSQDKGEKPRKLFLFKEEQCGNHHSGIECLPNA